MRFGRWVVVDRAEDFVYEHTIKGKRKTTSRYSQWNCVCDCGTKRVVLGANLARGKTRSCGCLKNELQRERSQAQKAYVKYKSLSNPPTKEEMLRVMLDDEYDSTPEEERLEKAFRNVFYNCWFKFVRDEQGVIRRYKREHPYCEICGKECETEVHHIRPVAEYGGNEPENIRWLCHDCHRELENERLRK